MDQLVEMLQGMREEMQSEIRKLSDKIDRVSAGAAQPRKPPARARLTDLDIHIGSKYWVGTATPHEVEIVDCFVNAKGEKVYDTHRLDGVTQGPKLLRKAEELFRTRAEADTVAPKRHSSASLKAQKKP